MTNRQRSADSLLSPVKSVYYCRIDNYVFRLQNFRGGGKTLKIRCQNFYAPVGHNVEKFGAIHPTYPDDIIQSTPDFLANFRILGIKNGGGRPMSDKGL